MHLENKAKFAVEISEPHKRHFKNNIVPIE